MTVTRVKDPVGFEASRLFETTMRALSWFCFVLMGTEISGFACHGPYSGTLGKVVTDHSCKLAQLHRRATHYAVLSLQAAAKDVWSVVGASSARGNQYYGGGNMVTCRLRSACFDLLRIRLKMFAHGGTTSKGRELNFGKDPSAGLTS